MGLDYDKFDYSTVEHGNWNDVPWEPIRGGITRTVFAMGAKGLCLTIGEVKEGHVTKPHTHPHEQVAIIIQGTCDYYVDGKPIRCKPGTWMVIPPNVEHYIHVFNTIEPVLNLDVFAPDRPEYTKAYTDFLNSLKEGKEGK